MKERIPLEEILEKVCDELEKKRLEYKEFFPERLDVFLLGGYSLDSYKEKYEIDLGELRETDDIDFYSADARILGDNITPMGARIELSKHFKNEFRVDIFDWISGVDHGHFKEKFDKMGIKSNKIKETENIDVYVIEPSLFVANKLLSYRQDSTREKDLIDVGKVYEGFKKRGYINIIKDIDRMVYLCGLTDELDMSKEIYNNLNS